jgi:CBS domain-containing protein
MQPDVAEMKRFLQDCPPFDGLDDELLSAAIRQMLGFYVNQHTLDQLFAQHSPALYIVRSGAFDLLAPDGHMIERLEQHDLFGYPSLLSGRLVVNSLKLVEDGIVYILPEPVFNRLRQQQQEFERYFIRAHGQRLLEEQGVRAPARSGGALTAAADSSLQRTVAEVIQRQAVMLPSHTSIRSAAERMRDERVSSVMIVDHDEAKLPTPYTLVGILTDRDLRNRVVAQGLSTELQVNAVMTQAPATVYGRQSLMDVLAVMIQHNIHHVPVLDEHEQPLGMITNTDLMRQQRSEPVMLISAINKAEDLTQLVQQATEIPAYMQTFAARVSDTPIVGRLLATLTDAMTKRLIHFYEREHGVAPAAYGWLAFGSQGREDQTLSSDQDNGLLLSDGLNEAQLSWFAGLGEYVCKGLHDCGIPLCPGNIMASNPDCRRTLSGWLERFTQWTREPTPKALMYCQIFFDSRLVHGHKRLYQHYREQVAQLGQHDLFLANLARLQVSVQVPLGLFNRFRGTESGKDSDFINIKRYGIALINDIVRTYALQAGLTAPQTLRRLELLAGSRLLNRRDSKALQEAWLFLTELRLQHQLQVWGTEQPKNALDPDGLGTLTRRQLKSAFRIIKECQQGIGLKFGRVG